MCSNVLPTFGNRSCCSATFVLLPVALTILVGATPVAEAASGHEVVPPTVPPATLPPMIVLEQKQSGESELAKPSVLQFLCDEQENLTDAEKSPVTVYLRSLYKSFREYHHQVVIALVALVIGSLCAWNGLQVWQAIFTATMVAAATSLAHMEADAWRFNLVSKLLLMFQAAFATGVAVQVGFDGFQVLFGTAMGFLGCYVCGGWARSFDEHIPGIALLWYSIGAVLGALVLTVWQRPVLVTLGPLLGGFLMTTGMVCMACVVARATNVAEPILLPALDEPWVHIARDLIFAMGPAALAAHAACAVAATVVYRATAADDRRFPAVCCLVACVIVTAAFGAVENSWWMVCASFVWAALSGLSTYRQLGFLQGWGPKSLGEVAENFSNAGFASFRSNYYETLPSNKRDVKADSVRTFGGGLASYFSAKP